MARNVHQSFARGGEREPAPVTTRYICPRCGEYHPRDRCPRRENAIYELGD